MMELLQTPIGRLRLVAILEGCSYLLLGITMPIKYMLGVPQPNYVVGMAHGILFVLYVALVVQVGFIYKWSFKKIFWALVASVVPFGTFYADKKLFKPEEERQAKNLNG